MGDIANIAELGIAGLALVFLYRIATNHLHDISGQVGDLTETVRDLADAFRELIDHLKSR